MELPPSKDDQVQQLTMALAVAVADLQAMREVFEQAERAGEQLSSEDITKASLLALSLVNESHPRLVTLRTELVYAVRGAIRRQEAGAISF
jgi:rRNA maturation endonuclease Nob1